MKRYHTDYCCGDETALVATDSEWSTIVNALRTAAAYYERAGENRLDNPLDGRMMAQFRRQAAEARALADKIAEEAGV